MTVAELKNLITRQDEVGSALRGARLESMGNSYTNGPQAAASKKSVCHYERAAQAAAGEMPDLGRYSANNIALASDDEDEQVSDVIDRLEARRSAFL